MTQTAHPAASPSPLPAGPARTFGNGFLFGIPLGELGWFAILLMGTAAGFAAFFAGTFCGIAGILLWNGVTHAAVDFSLSYRRVGLPLGLVVLTIAYAVLGTLRVKRIVRKA